MDRDDLGQSTYQAWKRWSRKQEQPQESIGWEELDENQKELYCQIGEYLLKTILQEHKGQLISVEDEGFRILGDSKQIPQLLQLLDKHQPETSFERPHMLNLYSAVQNAILNYKNRELSAFTKLKSFKDDVLTYLRAITLVAETVGNGGTHKEKDARMRGLISQIESAIQRVRTEDKHLFNYYWGNPDLFRSDYPVIEYLRQIRELKAENARLKGEQPDGEPTSF